MKLLGRKLTTCLVGGNIAALILGYILRAPDLQATAERQTTIRTQQTESALDRQEALQRAQTCILVRADMPLTDGAAAYYSSIQSGKVVINKHRPMPNGYKVCDRFGNTGIVDSSDGTPIVSDIRSMPPEEMEEILALRGLLKNPQPQSSKTWAAEEGISYPFKSPLELFLQTLKDGFQILLLLGPLNLYHEPLSKRSQRSNLNARIRLLSDKEWDDLDPLEGIPASPKRKKRVSSEKIRLPYKLAKRQYVRTLKKMGWNGYWLLALLKFKNQEPFKPLFEAYLAAFRAGSELFIPDFEWIDGQPYQAKHTSQRRAEAEIDTDGYIRWHWA